MEQKKGYKTSEFWTLVLTSLSMIANESGIFHFKIPLDVVNQAVTIASVYIGSRSLVKAAGAYAAIKFASANVQPAQNETINK